MLNGVGRLSGVGRAIGGGGLGGSAWGFWVILVSTIRSLSLSMIGLSLRTRRIVALSAPDLSILNSLDGSLYAVVLGFELSPVLGLFSARIRLMN